MDAATQKAAAKPTLLVVDDNPLVRGLLRELFLSEGFTSCAEAQTGSEAIDVARCCKPDLIILDVAMPVMNGIEAAPKLKELLPDTPIILFTLYGNFLKNRDLSAFGISATFAKSEPLDELIRKAHVLLGK
jgi:CheY-like chemotaxis protein